MSHVVRHGEHAVELRLGHTTASFYRIGEPMTGTVWDLCAWPALAFEAPSVLVLGLGGGSIARAIRHLAPNARITGVELDADVIAAARRDFALDELAIEVAIDDAVSFLERERRLFDLVVDDVFLARDGTLEKPPVLEARFEELVLSRLAPAGIAVANTVGPTPLEACLRRRFAHVVRGRCSDASNRVLAGSDRSLDELRRALFEHPALAALTSNATLE
jgi:spermidine synthase